MAHTRAELIYKALAVLGVIKTGQVPSAEDYAAVDGYVDDLIDRLSADDVVYVSDPDSIPAEWFQSLAVLLADDASDEYGTAINPQRVEVMTRRLKRLNRGRPAYGPIAAEDF